jgi:hypothetical protein
MLRLLAAAAAVLSLAAAGTASARTTAASCNLVSPTVLHAVLGITVGSLTRSTSPGGLTCAYTVNGVPGVVIVNFEKNVPLAVFQATKKSFSHSNPHARTLRGLGDSAFTATQGTRPFAFTLLFVHKGTSELSITATASLAKCKRLATRLLPHV